MPKPATTLARALIILAGVLPASLTADDRDVPYIQTPQTVVLAMLEMAEVGPDDHVIDLGSGDGRIPILAAREFGASGKGVEIDPDLVEISRKNAEAAGVSEQVRFTEGDLFDADLSEASVIALYLLPELNLRLRPALLALAPGTRVVSNEFDMDDWQPDQKQTVRNRPIYLWIVPADVAGHWQLSDGDQRMKIELEQCFQAVTGRAHLAGESYPLRDIKLEGKTLRFRLKQADTHWLFQGQVKAEEMSLEAQPALSGSATGRSWSGQRRASED